MSRKAKKSKNVNGMGSLRQLDNGNWEYRFVLGRNSDGSLNRPSITESDVPAVMSRAREMIRAYEISTRDFRNINNITISTLAAVWWEDHKGNVRRPTQDSYGYTKKHIIDGLGELRVQETRPPHINAFIKKLRDEGYHTPKGVQKFYSESQIHKILIMLHQMFDYAVEQEWIESNVIDKIIKKKTAKKKDGRISSAQASISKAFSPEEIKLILAAHNGSWISSAIIVDIFCGVREAELLALDKPHVKLDGSGVSIENALNREGGHYIIGDVKSDAGVRHVPVSAVARPMLTSLYNAATGDMLFPGRGTTTKNVSGYRKAYYVYIRSIPGVRALPPHKGCRHTYGTLLAAVGVPPAKIQYLMGHSDYRTTANTYTHLEGYFTKDVIKLIKSWGVGDFEKAPVKPRRWRLVEIKKSDAPKIEQ